MAVVVMTSACASDADTTSEPARTTSRAVQSVTSSASSTTTSATTTTIPVAEGESSSAVPTDPSASALTPRSATPNATITVAHPINSLVIASDAVWIGSATGISRIDPVTNSVGSEIAVTNAAGYFAFGFGSAWVSDYDASIVRRVAVSTGEVLAEIAVGRNPEGIALTDDAVWVANHRGGSLSRLDPSTNTVVATLDVGPTGPGGPQHLVEADGMLWVTVPNKQMVLRIDTASNTIDAEVVTTGAPCGEMALVNGRVWVAGCERSMYVIDATTAEEIDVLELVGQSGTAFSFGHRVWIPQAGMGSADPGRLLAIGPSFEFEDAIAVDADAYSVAPGFDSVWIAHANDGTVMRFAADAFDVSDEAS